MKLYSNDCPNCKAVKSVLKQKKVDFEEVNNMKSIMEVAQREQLAVMPILEIEGIYYSGTDAITKSKEI